MKKILLSTVIAGFFLQGCSTIQGLEDTENKIKKEKTFIEEYSSKYKDYKYVQFKNENYFGKFSIKEAEDPLLDKEISFNSKPTTIDEIASLLSTTLQIPVRVSMELPKDPSKVSDNQQQVATTDTKNSAYIVNQLEFKGKIRDLLNIISASTRTTWTKDNLGGITFKRYITKTYDLNAIFGTINLTKNITSTNTDSGAKSTANNTITSSGVDVYDDLLKGIKTILSEKGQVYVYKSNSTITVTDTYEKIADIDNVIKKFNDKLSKNILIVGKIFVVSESNDNDLSLETAINNATSELKIVNAFSGIASDASGSFSVNTIKDNGQLNLNLFIKTLNKYVQTSTLKDISIRTQNNQITPNQQVTEQSYLESVSSSLTSTGLSQSSLTPGKVSSGFSFNIIPVIMENNKILLEVNFDISSLTNLQKDSSNGNSITTPTVDKNSVWQRVILNNNDTVILSDITNSSDNLKNMSSFLNGIGKTGSSKNSRVFMILKAIVE